MSDSFELLPEAIEPTYDPLPQPTDTRITEEDSYRAYDPEHVQQFNQEMGLPNQPLPSSVATPSPLSDSQQPHQPQSIEQTTLAGESTSYSTLPSPISQTFDPSSGDHYSTLPSAPLSSPQSTQPLSSPSPYSRQQSEDSTTYSSVPLVNEGFASVPPPAELSSDFPDVPMALSDSASEWWMPQDVLSEAKELLEVYGNVQGLVTASIAADILSRTGAHQDQLALV